MSTPEDAIRWARESGLITGNEELALSRVADLEHRNAELTAENKRLNGVALHMAACRALLNVPDDEVLHEAIRELTARIAELEKELDDARFVNEDYQKSVANLEALLTEARKDGQRLEQQESFETNTRYTRFEDMSPNGTLTIIVQPDGDVIVTLFGRGMTDSMRMASVEFCFPGSGGGQSSHTRLALQKVAIAIKKDNEERAQHREPLPSPNQTL